jgi:nucleoid DNA-binding protein
VERSFWLEAYRQVGQKLNNHKLNKKWQAFVQEVTGTLFAGERHQTPGFGTFSTCTRKAKGDRAACTIAMFRPSAELREHASGGQPPDISGPHADAVNEIVGAMQSESGVDVPLLGRLALVQTPGKKPKLIFHGCAELNEVLTDS